MQLVQLFNTGYNLNMCLVMRRRDINVDFWITKYQGYELGGTNIFELDNIRMMCPDNLCQRKRKMWTW